MKMSEVSFEHAPIANVDDTCNMECEVGGLHKRQSPHKSQFE